MSSSIFPFQELPSDIKTQIFSFINFEDWLFVLSRVCTEWKKLCINSTLPKVIDGDMYPENYDYERLNFDKLLKLGKQYNVTGLVSPVELTMKMVLKAVRTIPRLSWIEGVTSDRSIEGKKKIKEVLDAVPNFITHFNTSLDSKITLSDIAKYLPNLTTLYYKNAVKLEDIQKVDIKFEKLKVLRVGVPRVAGISKARNMRDRKRMLKADPSGPLIELIQAFKNIAPNLELLYMFYPLPRGQPAVALDREFALLEEAAKKIGVRLVCRDLQQILNPALINDPQGKFFFRCFKQNGLPYHAYTVDETTLLSQAIVHLNVPVVKKIFAKNMTTLDYELTAVSETSRVAFSEYPLVAYQMREGRFNAEYLVPESTGAKSNEIVDLLRVKGYDVNTRLFLRYNKKLVVTPVWSELKFSHSSVRRLFENYPSQIQWFTRGRKGITLAHRFVISRGTNVLLDLMEEQLTKQQISELMSIQDNDGNTPVHLFSDSSIAIIDRLSPYVEHCWTIRNKRNENPLQYYIRRCKDSSIDIKEPKLTRILQETPEIDNGVIYSLFETAKPDVLTAVVPLLAVKGANFKESGKLGRAIFTHQTLALLNALKDVGVDLSEADENGNNVLHGLFWAVSDYGRWKVDTEALKFAVQEGANVNQINKAGETPLLKAVIAVRIKNLSEVVETLLECGADPNLHGEDQVTPLLLACQLPKMYDDIIVKLLEKGAKPVSVRTSMGYFSPLLACMFSHGGSNKRVRQFVAHGADVKERDELGNSLLHSFMSQAINNAASAKKEKIFEMLVQLIDINDTNYNGDTPLHSASSMDFVKWALAHGADINARNKFGDTPIISRKLRYMWQDPDKEVLKAFVRNPQIDWTAVNVNKFTMLHYLCHFPLSLFFFVNEILPSKSPEEQQKIKEAFATHSEYHENALFEAAQKNFLDGVKICVENFGISPAWKSHQTPLHFLSALRSDPTKGHMRVIEYLLEKGADVNAQEYSAGNTPLHIALKVGNTEQVKFYLDHGADPTIKNKAGVSPLDIAPDLLTRYKGAGKKWRVDPRQPPTEKDLFELVEAYRNILHRQEEGKDSDDEDDDSVVELFNSDNEDEEDPHYNEFNEDDVEEEYDEDNSQNEDDEDGLGSDEDEENDDDHDDDDEDEDNDGNDEDNEDEEEEEEQEEEDVY